jgi:threonyl-tRNA synthetase
MAEAVQELWPGTQVTIGPVIENGFYYDFASEPAVHAGRPAGDREEDARDHRSATSLSPRKSGRRDKARRVFATRARPTRSS